jgi:hypothetical protein
VDIIPVSDMKFFIFRRTVVSIPNGPSELAVKEAAWGLARYAAISQVHIKLDYRTKTART